MGGVAITFGHHGHSCGNSRLETRHRHCCSGHGDRSTGRREHVGVARVKVLHGECEAVISASGRVQYWDGSGMERGTRRCCCGDADAWLSCGDREISGCPIDESCDGNGCATPSHCRSPRCSDGVLKGGVVVCDRDFITGAGRNEVAEGRRRSGNHGSTTVDRGCLARSTLVDYSGDRSTVTNGESGHGHVGAGACNCRAVIDRERVRGIGVVVGDAESEANSGCDIIRERGLDARQQRGAIERRSRIG